MLWKWNGYFCLSGGVYFTFILSFISTYSLLTFHITSIVSLFSFFCFIFFSFWFLFRTNVHVAEWLNWHSAIPYAFQLNLIFKRSFACNRRKTKQKSVSISLFASSTFACLFSNLCMLIPFVQSIYSVFELNCYE